MAAPNIQSGAGFRHARYYLRDSAGYPSDSQTGSDGYSGVRIEGVKTLQSNIPDVQYIRHTGDDILFAQDSLPPTEAETATLTTAKSNLTVDAELGGTSVVTLGDLKLGGMGTDKMGFEPNVTLIVWRQALNTADGDAAFGTREYITVIYPSTRIVPKGGAMAEGAADENSYNVVPTPVIQYPWGLAYTTEAEGFTQAIKHRFHSENPLMMERYDAPGSVTTFLLDFTPISVAKTKAWVNGVAATVSSVSVSLKTFTLSVAPTAADKVVVLYEASDLA